MTSAQLHKIKEILEEHVGKKNQISSGKIGPKIGIHENATHIQVRSLIREAILRLRLPIGGGNRGYYLIKNRNELRQYTESIDNRISEMQKRKALINKAFEEYY